MIQKALFSMAVLFLSCSIFAQRDVNTRQVLRSNISKPPLSSRSSKSIAGPDTLGIQLINYDVPGLEIISCGNCKVDADWTKGYGELKVQVKNNGNTRSKPANVWIDYYYYQPSYTGPGFKPIHVDQRRGIGELNPGEMTEVKFLIKFHVVEVYYKSKSKLVQVSITQHPERVRG